MLMPIQITRRGGLVSLAAAFAIPSEAAEVSESFPTQPVDLIREAVTVAHGNFKRLKELVDARPSLSRAAYDWGFGDWEDCLGAASHVGNREIAEYLISKGARPTLYSAAMLGQLDVVKAFVAAQPGCQRIPGPHSISLLNHAIRGGTAAEPVRKFLETLGDAGSPVAAPITEAEMTALAGTYSFGAAARDTIEVTVAKGQLMFARKGSDARGLIHVGGLAFHPAGANAVRIKFADKGLTVHDPEPILAAKKIA